MTHSIISKTIRFSLRAFALVLCTGIALLSQAQYSYAGGAFDDYDQTWEEINHTFQNFEFVGYDGNKFVYKSDAGTITNTWSRSSESHEFGNYAIAVCGDSVNLYYTRKSEPDQDRDLVIKMNFSLYNVSHPSEKYTFQVRKYDGSDNGGKEASTGYLTDLRTPTGGELVPERYQGSTVEGLHYLYPNFVLDYVSLAEALMSGTWEIEFDSMQVYDDSSSSPNDDITDYRISFDANGGDGDSRLMPGGNVEEPYVIDNQPECRFTAPEGMKFAGWALSPDGEIVKFPYTLTGDTVFYAIWKDAVLDPDPDPEPDSTWLALQQAVQSSGTVTLTEDVICDDQTYGPITIPEDVSVTIDLNGYKIDRNLAEAVDGGDVIDVYGSLAVKDGSSGETGTITGGKNTANGNKMVAGGVQVNGGSFLLESGNITGCSSDMRGGGVNVQEGSFTMTGGSISGNAAASHGGGVDVTKGNFTMTGGSISENKASVGGGIYAAVSDLILSGGEISENTAKSSGGGINASGDVNVTLTGCKITGNKAPKAGGVRVFLNDSGEYSFKVGGNTIITDNTDVEGNASNLYLNNSINNKTMITIMDGEDAPDDMNIGISAEKAPAESAPIQISDISADINDLAYFTSDAAAYDLIYLGGSIKLAAKDMRGVTFISGAHGTDPDPVMIEKGSLLTRPADPSEYCYSFLGWYKDSDLQTAWDFENDLVNKNMILYGKWEDSVWLALQQAVKSSGTVTLTEDVICDNQEYGPITIPEDVSVTIDLNGYKIDRNLAEAVDGGDVIDVYGNLTVKDSSSGKTGTITGGKNTANGNEMVAGGVQVNGGSFVLESGNITGCSSGMRGAGVNVAKGSFTMTGGSISGNTASSHGGGVDVTNGTFTMTGGSISKNRANIGGGIYAAVSDMILSGGEISENTAKNIGGGINIPGDVNVTLTGCKIMGNKAPKAGGVCFYLKDSGDHTFKVGGNTIITGNTDTEGNASNLYLDKVSNRTAITILDGEDAPDGMDIGVSMAAPGKFSTNGTKAQKSFFDSDNSDYAVKYNDNGTTDITTDDYFELVDGYAITTDDAIANGSIVAASSAYAGETVNLKVKPDKGYQLKANSLKVTYNDGTEKFCELTAGENNIYTFTMPAYTVFVTAEFEIKPHTHSFTYGVDDSDKAQITATCTEGCTEGWDEKPLTLTLTAPSSIVYDAKAKTIAFADGETDAWKAATDKDAPEIEYFLEDGTTKTTNANSGAAGEGKAPVKAGKYVAKATVAYGETESVTAVKEFTIAKQTFSITYKDEGDNAFTGQHENGYPTEHTYGIETDLKSASKIGYTFDGWFTDSDCSGAAVTSLGAEEYSNDITLYAKWTKGSEPVHVHTPKLVNGQKATFTADGNIEHWICTGCGKHFADEAATTEISEADFVISKATATISKTTFTFNGKTQKPNVTVKDSKGNVINSVTVTNAGRKLVGKGTVKVVLSGNYSGTKIFTYKINPKQAAVSKATPSVKKLTVKMGTKVATTGGATYQIAYKQKGTSKWKYTTTTKQSKVIKKLKKGKRYYVKVRAYKTVNNVKYYGAWSKTKLSYKIK